MGSYRRNCSRRHPVVSDCLCSGRLRRHLKAHNRSSRSGYFNLFNTVLPVCYLAQMAPSGECLRRSTVTILAMCCEVISLFVIFAVLDLRVGGCRP